ncbi:TPA: flagellar basal body-associated protein FliL [Campylobacter lari]|nr:flagellar basal body-associated protein FliL [Campylobacter lari]MCV3438797.1 flagellar basal body-associated protein FliL [Campylobacter lari]HEC1784773.1 flagellar basal body-associated protein FliL [Campylobacter lari]HEC1804013.1 flagellar basal body-associated protein FliL [Campylobacter lari]HEC1811073.1 flagellar basal body-associated protein FliL [Campylobacter lari]
MADDMIDEQGESKKKGGNTLVIIIVVFLFVFLLVIIGAIAYLMFSGSSDENPAPQAEESAQVAPAPKKTNSVAARGSDYANIGVMYPLAPFTLNLLSDGGARYVKCTIQLEQNVETLTPELDKKSAIIRDIIIRTLTSKTFEEVSTTKGKERLKDELTGKINEVLTDGFIKNIYFTDFVVS